VVLARTRFSLLTDLLIFGLFAMSLDLILGVTGMLFVSGHAASRPGARMRARFVLLEFAQAGARRAPAGMVLAGAVALPVGWFLRAPRGVYFAMLTVAFAQFLYTVAYKWRSLTGGSDGIAAVPKTALFRAAQPGLVARVSTSWPPPAWCFSLVLCARSSARRSAGALQA